MGGRKNTIKLVKNKNYNSLFHINQMGYIHVKYSNITAEWYTDGKSNDRNNVKAYTTYSKIYKPFIARFRK